jgi:hypothetical protein
MSIRWYYGIHYQSVEIRLCPYVFALHGLAQKASTVTHNNQNNKLNNSKIKTCCVLMLELVFLLVDVGAWPRDMVLFRAEKGVNKSLLFDVALLWLVGRFGRLLKGSKLQKLTNLKYC